MKAYQLKIELVDSPPLTWRGVIIPAGVTFKRLHDTIQFSMDWGGCHLYEFELPEEKLRITNDEESYNEFKYYSAKHKKKKPAKEEDPYGMIAGILETTIRQPQTLKIVQYLEKFKTLEYVYDFRDYWRHRVGHRAMTIITRACRMVITV